MTTLTAAVDSVNDGDEVYFGGFGYNQPFAAAHELLRQGTTDLRVVRTSGDILLDQLIGAGRVRTAVISHCWNAIGPSPTHAFRRATEHDNPRPLDVEEYGLGDLLLRLFAGARRLPFVPAGAVEGTGQFDHRVAEDKYLPVAVEGDIHYVMRPLQPDVGFIHVPRADAAGNAQLRGPHAEIKHGALACDTLVVQAETIVDTATIREAPGETIVPSFAVDHVVEVPGGSHPSGVLDRYDRDVEYLQHYGAETDTVDAFETFLEKWVYDVDDRAAYLTLLESEGFGGIQA